MPPAPAPSTWPTARGKLAPPQLAFEAVLPRAAEVLLRSAVLAKLVTVFAPVGYGKTMILNRLHQTLAQRGGRCIWITLDDRDVAVSSILYLVQAAIAAAGLPLPAGTGSEPHPAGDDPRSGIDRLQHLLEGLDGQTTLFIDNLSFCTDPLLPPLLERLAFASSPQLRLVLSGTERMPLDATRARLELGAVELQASHLAFDAECSARVLQQTGVLHDADTVQRVQELTEGWPAAVRLVQILMAESPETSSVLARFSGTDRDMADVLTRRVLAGFDVAMVTFLVEIAPLREFSAPLAAHVTGRDQAEAWIAQLLDRNILVFPLDRSRDWLRMHTLLRQYLLAEGVRRLPRERRREILERAAQWHINAGDDIAALEAALEAPSPTLAGRLLDRVARVVAGEQGRLSLYIRWVEQLLACGVTLSLEAHTWYVWSLCFTLQYEHAHRAMDALDHRLAEADPQGSLRALQARLGLLRVVVATYLDMMDSARTEAERWLLHSAQRAPLAVASVASSASVAELARENLGGARRHLQHAAAAITRSTSSYGHAWVSVVAACVELADAEPLVADRVLTQARVQAAAALGEDASIVTTIDFVHSRALVDVGRTEAARQKAAAGLRRAAIHGICETAINGLSACVSLWDGSPEHAFAPEVLETVARSYPPRVQRVLSVLQVRRLLTLGHTHEAQAVARRQLLELQLQHGSAGSSSERLLALQLMVAGGDTRQALALIEQQVRLCIAGDRTRELVQLHLLAAEIHVHADQQRAALRSLTLALVAAARRRLVHPFLEQSALVARILEAVADRELGVGQPDELALLAQLRAMCTPAGRPDALRPLDQVPVASTGGPLEALTTRELQLLELLGQGLSNQQIADRTALSLPTVKWHFSNVYAKLQVKNRSAALARARGLQLLRN